MSSSNDRRRDSAAAVTRARAPLRLGLAGGGTDVSPYCNDYGGAVLNATIDRYAYASLSPRDDGQVVFEATDIGEADRAEAGELSLDQGLKLHRAVYNRMIADYNGGRPIPLTLRTHVDSPMGSGLGSSSALVVAMIEALNEYVRAPLGEYDLARLAFQVERVDLGLNGGRQDQYAATFGGFNFMEFGLGDKVVVNPLRIRRSVICELEASLLLFFTGASRESAKIIDNQTRSVSAGGDALEAMHKLKADAAAMKEALLFGRMDDLVDILRTSWEAKKRLAQTVSNPQIDEIYDMALRHGAKAGKISGAGGGGFFMFLVDPSRRIELMRALRGVEGGEAGLCQFTNEGCTHWTL